MVCQSPDQVEPLLNTLKMQSASLLTCRNFYFRIVGIFRDSVFECVLNDRLQIRNRVPCT